MQGSPDRQIFIVQRLLFPAENSLAQVQLNQLLAVAP